MVSRDNGALMDCMWVVLSIPTEYFLSLISNYVVFDKFCKI